MAVASRHASGCRLIGSDRCVVDNHCPLGDATIDIPGVGAVCAASTVSFAFLAQMFNMGVIRYLFEHGKRSACSSAPTWGESNAVTKLIPLLAG